jgi:hypothetical protein
MAEIQQNRPSALASDDRIGKPFLVMAGNIRKCLVCEELFTREEAPRHSRVVCYVTSVLKRRYAHSGGASHRPAQWR